MNKILKHIGSVFLPIPNATVPSKIKKILFFIVVIAINIIGYNVFSTNVFILVLFSSIYCLYRFKFFTRNKSQFMKKAKKSLISIFLNGFANIFSFKEYSIRPRRTKSNYFKRNKSQFSSIQVISILIINIIG